jgi:predicted CopG family antitoxin
MESATTIQISQKSKKKLASLKNHPNESFDDMINRLLVAFVEEDTNLLTQKDIRDIEKSMRDIKSGKFMTNEQLKKKYNI